MSSTGRSGFWETYRGPLSDPRTIVTPDAFSVHPDLLGIPLAQHPRRMAAILLDLLVIAVLAQAGGLLLGVLAAAFLLRATFKQRDDRAPSLMGTTFRGLVGCFGAAILLVTAIVLWSAVMGRTGDPGPPDRPSQVAREDGRITTAGGLRGLVAGFAEGARYRQAEGEEDARERALVLAERARGIGLSESEIRELLVELAPEAAPWRDAVAGWDLRGAPEETVEPEDEADPAPEEEPADPVPPELADSLRTLEERVEAESRRRERAERALVGVERELQEARSDLEGTRTMPGIRAFLRRIAEDLGLGFGWAALYFTVFTTWWRGRTPGKRLMRLRVVRLSGEPLTWWDSFERYGGYAAGFATGLLGFAQVYWDPNRQAIHDRIGRTVVIQDGKPPVPGRWKAEARPILRSPPRAGEGALRPDPEENT